jgi:hypothetical protein
MSGDGEGGGRGSADVPPGGDGSGTTERRPLVERIGLAAIAAVLAALFAFVAVASWVSGEAFLAFMGALGVGMTGWVGLRTLFRG